MSSPLINLEQLKMSMQRIRLFCETNFCAKDHTHDEKYYTKTEVNGIRDSLKTNVDSKANANHTHTSNDILKMTGYVKPADTSAIADTDSLNVAIGKLEKGLDNVSSNRPNYDDTYLKLNATAVAAKKLESPRQINLGGAVNGLASFDGSADITIATTLSNLSSDKVTSLTGYAKSDAASSILVTDSLNVAIGKLEKGLEGKQDAGEYAPKNHNHNDLYYTKAVLDEMLADIESGGSASLETSKQYTDSAISNLIGNATPESLDTLKELANALGNDPNFSTTILNKIGEKADKDHTHLDATTAKSGFMSSTDKAKLDGIQENANNYVHPDTAGHKHIPAGGAAGQALIYSEDGTAVWGNVSVTDQYVKNNLNTTAKAYITGTTSDATQIGEQVFDTGVYLTENAGELKATTFVGDLTGTATKALTADACAGSAASADKTKEALSISLNGVPQKSFNGSEAVSIQITATSVGAPTINQFEDATKQATDDEVTKMLDLVF